MPAEKDFEGGEMEGRGDSSREMGLYIMLQGPSGDIFGSKRKDLSSGAAAGLRVLPFVVPGLAVGALQFNCPSGKQDCIEKQALLPLWGNRDKVG
jgi:hypothetical protein